MTRSANTARVLGARTARLYEYDWQAQSQPADMSLTDDERKARTIARKREMGDPLRVRAARIVRARNILAYGIAAVDESWLSSLPDSSLQAIIDGAA